MSGFININGKNVDIALAQQLYADGNFDKNDREQLGGLTKAEARDLAEALSGTAKDVIDGGLISEAVVEAKQPELPEQKSKFGKWFNKNKGTIANVGKAVAGVALIGVGAFAILGSGGTAAGAGGLLSWKGAALIAGALCLSGCAKFEMDQYQFQESNRKELNEIIKLLTQIAGDVSTIKDKQITKDDLDKYRNNFKIYLDNFRENVTDDLGDVIEGQKNNLSVLDNIYIYLQNNVKPGDQAAILALMQKIIDKIDGLRISNQDIGEDLAAKIDQFMALVTKFGNSQAESLDKIVDLMIKGNENTGAILTLLQNLKPGESKDEEILAVLEKILVQVTQNGQENDENFATVIALLTAIKNGQKLTNDQMKVLIDLMKQGNADVNLIKQLLENQQVDFTELKKLIVEGNKIAKYTKDLIAQLGLKVKTMDDNRKAEAQAILDAIQNISTGDGTLDLTTVESLLSKLLQQAEDGNKKLTELGEDMIDINAAIKIVQNTLLRIEDKIPESDRALLLDIYNKIPDGCHCDIAGILAKLEIIIKELEADQDSSRHEGILEDLDEYFS